MCLYIMEILIIKKPIFPISACVKKWKPFLAEKIGFYVKFFKKILNHSNIEVKLNTDYFEYIKDNKYDYIIFTGPIDSYFTNLEKLEYRSIDFNIEIIKNMNYYQPNSVVNYPSIDVPYTRIVEYTTTTIRL